MGSLASRQNASWKAPSARPAGTARISAEAHPRETRARAQDKPLPAGPQESVRRHKVESQAETEPLGVPEETQAHGASDHAQIASRCGQFTTPDGETDQASEEANTHLPSSSRLAGANYEGGMNKVRTKGKDLSMG